jgi:hypothetical protein
VEVEFNAVKDFRLLFTTIRIGIRESVSVDRGVGAVCCCCSLCAGVAGAFLLLLCQLFLLLFFGVGLRLWFLLLQPLLFGRLGC